MFPSFAVQDVVLIPGDGIGPEVTDAAVRVLVASGASLRFRVAIAGERAVAEGKPALPDATIRLIRRIGVALKGPLTTPIGGGYRSVNVAIRERFNLYANVRPVRGPIVWHGRRTALTVDLVLIRENTEDLYAGMEFPVRRTRAVRQLVASQLQRRLRSDAAVALKVVSVQGSRRIAAFAFRYAAAHRRRRVTVVHKANILKATDGLFLREVRKVAGRFPRIAYEELIVDNAAQQLVLHPERFDVLLCPNLYGDILTDLAGALIGGIGLLPAAEIGDRVALFGPVHGTAPDIAGQGIANPTAMIRSAAMLLSHLGEHRRAASVEAALRAALAKPAGRTRDLGGRSDTETFTRAVLRELSRH